MVAEYSYNAWGEILSATGTMAAINPLRYRGYYYDSESGLYYLKSRYYDPALCRFINADGLASTGQGFTGTNMFAYCLDNPVNGVDEEGYTGKDVLYTFEETRYGGELAVYMVLLSATAFASQRQRISSSINTSFAKSQFRTYRTGRETHHLVAKGAKNAEYAKEVLESVGISINSPENLLSIKTGLHRRIHTDLYYGWANSVVISAYKHAGSDPTKQKEAVYSALYIIKGFVRFLDSIAPF